MPYNAKHFDFTLAQKSVQVSPKKQETLTNSMDATGATSGAAAVAPSPSLRSVSFS
jgi:hypothetical protein